MPYTGKTSPDSDLENKINTNRKNAELNKLSSEDQSAHDWYRFVLSYPPHLVREYLQKFNVNNHQYVLDPFCGTGTTLVECKKLGITSIGIEANDFASFASQVKTNWIINPENFLEHSHYVAQQALTKLEQNGIEDNPLFMGLNTTDQLLSRLYKLEPHIEKLLLTNSISPLPLHKALVLRNCLFQYRDERFHAHQLLAFANTLAFSISNLRFGPEVGIGSIKADAPVIAAWLEKISRMAKDLRQLQTLESIPTLVHHADAREVLQVIKPNSIDVVITSPPYPNEKDYTRTTRLESVMLGFIKNKAELQTLKRTMLRSNTRGVYKGDDDDRWIDNHVEIQRIAALIEDRRIKMGKTSGFEKLYAKVTKLYFGGMKRHLADLRHVLRPGAQLAYVVGDQASYLRVMIRTGQLLAEIAESLGYEVTGIDLFRTRLATATKEQLREEVVLLRWSGNSIPSPTDY